MHKLLSVAIHAASSPSPSPTDPANTFYSPGTVGFLATFGVTLAAVLLIFDMVRRVRRVRYRAEIEAKLAEEEASAAKAASSGAKRNKK
ncbi:MAG: hypothetical protein RL488_331 [Actinomycetota bacterium]|jgi:hypothetical protein